MYNDTCKNSRQASCGDETQANRSGNRDGVVAEDGGEMHRYAPSKRRVNRRLKVNSYFSPQMCDAL